jgi:hypothetical protein
VSEIPARQKIPERIISKKVVPPGIEEVVAGRARVGIRAIPQRIVKEAGEGEAVKGTAEAGKSEAGKVAGSRQITGPGEAKVGRKGRDKQVRPWAARAILPEEYGENSVTLMTVDPCRLFAFWEVREKTLEIFKGQVNIRVYDVTGIDFNMMDTNSYLDISADARVGKCYINVSPEREYLADAGIIFDGIFIAVARSSRVSTPRAAVPEEGVFPYGIWQTGLRTGY